VSERDELFAQIGAELDHAYAKHGRDPWGRHEFYAILKEEVDELWDAIKADAPQADVRAELTQVAAMCFRYFETGDRYRSTDEGTSATSPT
jgi:NTP pyrophosphatase (non-canonical NTP hydrolase)